MIDEKALALLRRMREGTGARFGELLLTISNPRTLSLKLRTLEGEGIIAKGDGLYRLSERGRRALSLLEEYSKLLGRGEGLRGLDRVPHSYYSPLLRDYCELLSSFYGGRLEGVVLFGSVARGDWKRESDIDLLLVVDGWETQSDRDRFQELSSLKERLARSPSHREAMSAGFVPAIHELPLTVGELSEFRPIYLDIALDGIVLLDRVGKLKEFIERVRARATAAGSRRVVYPDGKFYWVLKEARPGEVVELGFER